MLRCKEKVRGKKVGQGNGIATMKLHGQERAWKQRIVVGGGFA